MRILAYNGDRLRHAGCRTQRGFDLAQLDPEPAQLHLRVRPADIVEGALRRPLRQIAGAVHARTDALERIRDESSHRQSWTSEVPARELYSEDIDLAHHSDRHWTQTLIEDVRSEAVDRGPDRVSDVLVDTADMVMCHVHRGLGDPVHVAQQRRIDPVRIEPSGELARIEGLAPNTMCLNAVGDDDAARSASTNW